jgi:hypothetical protein
MWRSVRYQPADHIPADGQQQHDDDEADETRALSFVHEWQYVKPLRNAASFAISRGL